MSWVKKRGAKWYVGYTKADGAPVLKVTDARTKAEAERLASEHALREHRIREGLEQAPPPPMIWGEFCDLFIREEVPKRRSPGTLLSRLKRLRKAFDGRYLASIRFADVSAYLADTEKLRMRNGKPLSPGSTEHLRRTLRLMFNAALKRGLYRGSNPAAEVEEIKVPERVPVYLDLPEIVRLLSVVPIEWRPLVACGIALGLRKGELLGLRTRNVHLARQVIVVEHSYDGPPKNGKPRTVAIPDELVPFLVAQLKTAGRGEYLFPPIPGVRLPEGAKRMTKDTDLVGRLRGWLEEAGVATAALWKDLRSTFGTHAAEQVADIRFAQKSLGHSDPRLTEQRYAHLRESNLVRQGRGLRLLGADKSLTAASLETVGAGSTGGNPPVKPAPSIQRAILDSNQWPLAPEAIPEGRKARQRLASADHGIASASTGKSAPADTGLTTDDEPDPTGVLALAKRLGLNVAPMKRGGR